MIENKIMAIVGNLFHGMVCEEVMELAERASSAECRVTATADILREAVTWYLHRAPEGAVRDSALFSARQTLNAWLECHNGTPDHEYIEAALKAASESCPSREELLKNLYGR